MGALMLSYNELAKSKKIDLKQILIYFFGWY